MPAPTKPRRLAGAIAALAVAIGAGALLLPRPPVRIEALAVPPALAAAGFTPDVVARRLGDAMVASARAVRDPHEGRPVGALDTAWHEVAPAEDGAWLRDAAAGLRGMLGRPVHRIGGEITAAGDGWRLRLRDGRAGVIAQLDGSAADGVDALLDRAGPEVWRAVSPQIHAWYLARSVADQAELRRRLAALRARGDPALDAAVTLLTARSLVASGRLGDALGMLDALAAARPADAGAQYGRAMALHALGRPDQALAAQRQGLALDPGNGPAHRIVAALLRELGRPEEALAAARTAQALEADGRAALIEEATSLQAMGRQAEAAEAARRALVLDPAYPPALAALGLALLAQGEVAPALGLFAPLLRLRPGVAEAEAAVQRVAGALAGFAGSLVADAGRGVHYWAMALDAYQAALAHAPDRAALHLGLGTAALRLGRPVVALEALSRARELGIGDAYLDALMAEARAMAR